MFLPAQALPKRKGSHVVHALRQGEAYSLCGARAVAFATLTFADLLPTCPNCKAELRKENHA